MGLEPGTDPATDALGQLPAVLAGAGLVSTRPVPSHWQPGPGTAGALLSSGNFQGKCQAGVLQTLAGDGRAPTGTLGTGVPFLCPYLLSY